MIVLHPLAAEILLFSALAVGIALVLISVARARRRK